MILCRQHIRKLLKMCSGNRNHRPDKILGSDDASASFLRFSATARSTAIMAMLLCRLSFSTPCG